MKKKKHKKNDFLEKYSRIINKHKDTLPAFENLECYAHEPIHTNSWFSMHRCVSNEKYNMKVNKTDKIPVSEYKMIKVNMSLNATHKRIFQTWFKASTLIYNETLKFIKTTYPFTKCAITKNTIGDNKDFYNSYFIRNQMKDIKLRIQEAFTIIIDKEKTMEKKKDLKCCIDIHTLDKTIFQLTQNIKSAVSNTKSGNFKFFRLRRWRYSRPSQTIEFEKGKIKEGIFCKSIFGKLPPIKYSYNNKEFNLNDITTDFKVNYNSILNKYTMMVPVKIESAKPNETDNIIVLDPGLRTFMTGISNNEYVSIGNDIHCKIKDSLTRLNRIKNNETISGKIKKKIERIVNRKIENRVNEMHWKIINFLTTHYDTILLGDMSAKSIVKKSSSVLGGIAKTACLRMKFYEFRMRLIYKCGARQRKYKLMDEFYTSKTCSQCGNYNEELKGETKYDCKKCKTSIHRDINGCRNIYMKQYI